MYCGGDHIDRLFYFAGYRPSLTGSNRPQTCTAGQKSSHPENDSRVTIPGLIGNQILMEFFNKI